MKIMIAKRSSSLSKLLVWVVLCSLKAQASTDHDAIFATLFGSESHPYFHQAYSNTELAKLKNLYQLNQNQLLWFSNKYPIRTINQLLGYYSDAPSQGLNSNDYAHQYLSRQWQKIQQTSPDFYQFAAFDTALSLTFLRYLNDLHYGRILPQLQGFHLENKIPIDLSSQIYQAIQKNDISALIEKLEPKLPPYQQLKTALIKYRQLDHYFKKPLHFELKQSLRPNEWSTEVSKLRRYLDAVNSPQALPLEDNTGNFYTGNIIDQVRKLQTQHGQLNDGIIGQQTLSILNTPLSQRVQQIELAMERIRWLPEQNQGAFILVNIPAFQLRAYDTNQSQGDTLQMKVIVGKALNRVRTPEKREEQETELQTPVFTGKLSYLVFNPYWNIPESILKNEILPQLEEHPDYLQNHNMEIVSRFSHHAQVLEINAENLERLYNGQLNLRQRPGRKNALGHIKFIFPNKHNIYLHDTPAHSLFRRYKRDFSHGCIRIEQPNALANFILKNQPEWGPQKIQQAIKSKKPKIVDINQSIPILIYYTTASATQEGVTFYPDIYKHDNNLISALAQRSELFTTRPPP